MTKQELVDELNYTIPMQKISLDGTITPPPDKKVFMDTVKNALRKQSIISQFKEDIDKLKEMGFI